MPRLDCTNTSDAQRILYDVNGVQRILRPGQSMTIDFHTNKARALLNAHKNGEGRLDVTALDHIPEVEADDQGRNQDFTHKDRDPNIVDAETVAEALKKSGAGMSHGNAVERHQQQNNDQDERQADGQGKDPLEGDYRDGEKVERIKPKNKQADPVQANATQKAKPKPAPAKPKGPPTDAAELLNRKGEFKMADFVLHSNRILGKNVLSQAPSDKEVITKLRERARADAQHARKNKN